MVLPDPGPPAPSHPHTCRPPRGAAERWGVQLTALTCAALALCHPGLAAGQVRISVETEAATPHAGACFDATSLRARAIHYGGEAILGAPLQARLRLDRDGSGELRLEHDDKVVSRRVLADLPTACEDKRDAVALTLVMALEYATQHDPAPRPAPNASESRRAPRSPKRQREKRGRPATVTGRRAATTTPPPAGGIRRDGVAQGEAPVATEADAAQAPAAALPDAPPAGAAARASASADAARLDPASEGAAPPDSPAAGAAGPEPPPEVNAERASPPPEYRSVSISGFRDDPSGDLDGQPADDSEHRLQLRLRLGGQWLLGSLPWSIAVGALGIEAAWPSGLAVRASAFAAPSSSWSFVGGHLHAVPAGLEVQGCLGMRMASLLAQTCLGATAAAYFLTGTGYPAARPSQTAYWSAGNVRLGLRWPEDDDLALQLFAQAHVNLLTPELEIMDASESARAGPVGAGLGAEVVVRID